MIKGLYGRIVLMSYADTIATLLNVKPSQVDATIHLLDEGNTVPFISRYRKEMTGTLDDEQVRIVADEVVRLRWSGCGELMTDGQQSFLP